MKIIITGGSGFIGTHLISKLSKEHQITVFDSKKPMAQSGTSFIEGDIGNCEQVLDSVKNCDVVIHLAAVVGVENSESNLIKTLDVNIGGTRNILESCRINKIKKIIFSSSSEIYGEPLKIPIEESQKPIPITTYGVSKLAAEEYVKSYCKTFGMKYAILRFFNAYGPGQSTEFVIPRFVKLALRNEPITIHNDGAQVRAFCYIDDIVQGISLAVTRGDQEIMNIGNDSEPISIKDLAKKIISMTNSKSNVIFLPFEDSKRKRNEIINRMPSIVRAKQILDYQPRFTLNDGITKIIDFLKEIQ